MPTVIFRLRRRFRRNPQRGMALFLAIAMMLLLSLLGATVLDLASRDVRATGRIDVNNQVFYDADRIVTFGQHRVDMVLDALTENMQGTTWPIDDPTGGTALDGMESGTITYVGLTELEIMKSSKRTPARGNVFHIKAITSSAGTAPVRVSVDSAYVKILSVQAEDKTFGKKDLSRLAVDAGR